MAVREVAALSIAEVMELASTLSHKRRCKKIVSEIHMKIATQEKGSPLDVVGTGTGERGGGEKKSGEKSGFGEHVEGLEMKKAKDGVRVRVEERTGGKRGRASRSSREHSESE